MGCLRGLFRCLRRWGGEGNESRTGTATVTATTTRHGHGHEGRTATASRLRPPFIAPIGSVHPEWKGVIDVRLASGSVPQRSYYISARTTFFLPTSATIFRFPPRART